MNDRIKYVILIIFISACFTVFSQTKNTKVVVGLDIDESSQTITGFGASLAYYENWLTAHPNRSEIYKVIFKELSLDILRVRNTYGYDNSMIGRVKQFANAANSNLGHPIDILVTSWGPPASLKSNNDRKNGGTIKYTVIGSGVDFDYSTFANWWDESLDDYNSNEIYPTYISIQNEPDYSASWESCLLKPSETITSSDTIAGYNKALDAVYEVVTQRDNAPHFLGPECIGIGYNAVENYVKALDLNKLYGIGHHLYHGAESGTGDDGPFTSSNYKKVGDFHPEVPHFQTEYSRADWFSVAAMMYQSLVEESVTAFLYWDLVWVNGAGLVSIDNPWDRSSWSNSKGFVRTKDFYVFKHYSAFIHPGWKRVSTNQVDDNLKTTAFINPASDSAAFIAINRSETDSFRVVVDLPGFNIYEANAYTTSGNENFKQVNYLADTIIIIPPKSIGTIDLCISETNSAPKLLKSAGSIFDVTNYPNPFSGSTKIEFRLRGQEEITLSVFNSRGQQLVKKQLGLYPPGANSYTFYRNGLGSGIYFYKLEGTSGKFALGKFIILPKTHL